VPVPAKRIVLVIEGPDRDGGHVRLDVFASQLKQLNKALGRADEISSDGGRSIHFAVVGLSHSSPATVELEARLNKGRRDFRSQVFARLSRTIESAENGKVEEDTDYQLLADLKALTAPVGFSIQTSTLKLGDAAFGLTSALSKKMEVQLEEHESGTTTIEGMLERINVHDDANLFTIYPDVGPQSVPCHFPLDQVETAVAAVKKRVAVSGIAKYRKLTPFPYQLNVSDIEIYDPEDALPSFDDLRGIAPDATENEPAEVFIARFRDGWV